MKLRIDSKKEFRLSSVSQKKYKDNNMTNFDKFAQDIGFNNAKDFCNLVGKVDRSDAIYRIWFSEWRSDRKGTPPFTKKGLLSLLRKIEENKKTMRMANKTLHLTSWPLDCA